MQTTCCFALHDKAWVNDPDGNEWEVFTVIEDNLEESKSSDASCCTPTLIGIGSNKSEAAASCC